MNGIRLRDWSHVAHIGRTAGAVTRHVIARTWPRQRLHSKWLPDLYNYRIFEVAPHRIDRKLGYDASDRAGIMAATRPIADASRHQFLLSGDWDLCYHQLGIADVVEEYCGRGLPMEATHRYRMMMSFIAEGRYDLARGCRTEKDLTSYFLRIRRLHENMRDRGYRRSSWIGREGGGREIEIAVGRDGGLYMMRNGNHRLAIAKLLQLPSVPVHVKAVHSDFLVGRATSQPINPVELDDILTGHMTSVS